MMDPEQPPQPTSDLNEFSRRVREARSRTRAVQAEGQGVRAAHGDDALSEALEELGVADEELRQQNDELAASRDAIDRERQKYLELFDAAPDAYIVTDEHGTVREANTAAGELLGVSRQFLIGKPLSIYFDDAARRAFRHQLDQLCGMPRIEDWEITLRPRAGQRTPASVSVGRISAKDKSITGFRWILRDISRRKAAEEEVHKLNRELELRVASRTAQLASANKVKDELLVSEREAREQAERSNRIKSDFLALLSHEFRTPLQAIFGYTELLAQQIHGPLNELQQRDISRIQHSQQHLLGLINTILEFAKLESGKWPEIACHPTVMNATLSTLEALVGPHLEERNLHYQYKCADPAVVAQADPAKVQQIVLNLLANAIKFTPPGGSIVVQCGLEPEYVTIDVIDTGRGIPPDKLETIFEPFVQLKSGGASLNGTGLGLPISRRLAEAMGGSLTATSELGKGSTFTLRLPRAGGSAVQNPPPATIAPSV
ncbi:MAG TPA: ATP-binding protein [Gemmatimonadaceae bacterium]|nr:ATP-binding protein [Gemmatimonadaceae bacterium]